MAEGAAAHPHPSALARPASRSRAWCLAIITAALFMTLDQVSKQIVIHSIGRGEHVRLIFGTRLTNVHNQGVAFGAFAGHGIVVVILTLAALAALIAYFALRATTPLLWLPVGVVIGGALGNLADRARIGAVTDFIDVRIWPTFNLADAGIVLGILALLYMIEGSRRAPAGSS